MVWYGMVHVDLYSAIVSGGALNSTQTKPI